MRKALLLIVMVLAFGLYASADTLITVLSGPSTATVNTSTAGNSGSPWTIGQNYTGTGSATLQFDTETGSPVGPGNPTGTGHYNGRWFEITLTNNTGSAWTSFELELQSVLGQASSDGDGLSFGQGGGLTFSSDVFSTYTRIDLERDYLNFSGGTVDPGQTVNFLFVITDNQTNNPIWLFETPNKVDSQIPEPMTLLLVGSGLGLGAIRKKLNK